MGRGNWGNHPELVRLRENYRKRKVSAEEVAEIKALISNQKKIEPMIRVVEDKPFKSGMRFRVRQNVIPILSETRKPRAP